MVGMAQLDQVHNVHVIGAGGLCMQARHPFVVVVLQDINAFDHRGPIREIALFERDADETALELQRVLLDL